MHAQEIRAQVQFDSAKCTKNPARVLALLFCDALPNGPTKTDTTTIKTSDQFVSHLTFCTSVISSCTIDPSFLGHEQTSSDADQRL